MEDETLRQWCCTFSRQIFLAECEQPAQPEQTPGSVVSGVPLPSHALAHLAEDGAQRASMLYRLCRSPQSGLCNALVARGHTVQHDAAYCVCAVLQAAHPALWRALVACARVVRARDPCVYFRAPLRLAVSVREVERFALRCRDCVARLRSAAPVEDSALVKDARVAARVAEAYMLAVCTPAEGRRLLEQLRRPSHVAADIDAPRDVAAPCHRKRVRLACPATCDDAGEASGAAAASDVPWPPAEAGAGLDALDAHGWAEVAAAAARAARRRFGRAVAEWVAAPCGRADECLTCEQSCSQPHPARVQGVSLFPEPPQLVTTLTLWRRLLICGLWLFLYARRADSVAARATADGDGAAVERVVVACARVLKEARGYATRCCPVCDRGPRKEQPRLSWSVLHEGPPSQPHDGAGIDEAESHAPIAPGVADAKTSCDDDLAGNTQGARGAPSAVGDAMGCGPAVRHARLTAYLADRVRAASALCACERCRERGGPRRGAVGGGTGEASDTCRAHEWVVPGDDGAGRSFTPATATLQVIVERAVLGPDLACGPTAALFFSAGPAGPASGATHTATVVNDAEPHAGLLRLLDFVPRIPCVRAEDGVVECGCCMTWFHQSCIAPAQRDFMHSRFLCHTCRLRQHRELRQTSSVWQSLRCTRYDEE